MSEFEKNNGTQIEEPNNGVQGGDAIDLGSGAAEEFDPFGDTSFADEPEKKAAENEKSNETTKPSQKSDKKDVSKKEEKPANPLEEAINAAETKDAEDAQTNLFAKPPVFSYAAASEDVDDTSKTFEDLRLEKSEDFPELEDGKRVSWTVEYGKITKTVPNPKGTTIGKMKSDIETSKEFLEALKKSKDKNPVCKLKPRVTAQTKGKLPSYKGIFTSVEDAVASGKVISLFPAADGKVYEMRKNEMGTFTTPITRSDILSEVKAGFIPALPLVPHEHLLDVVSFFRAVAHKGNYEALVNVYWDTEEEGYIVDVPNQTVTSVSVDCEPNPYYENDRYIHYMDIHSHNRMKAFFSATDNKDEKATRVYAVIGKIYDYFPQIKVRISNGGSYMEIEPGVVFENFDYNADLAKAWEAQVKVMVGDTAPDAKETSGAIRFLNLLMDGDEE